MKKNPNYFLSSSQSSQQQQQQSQQQREASFVSPISTYDGSWGMMVLVEEGQDGYNFQYIQD